MRLLFHLLISLLQTGTPLCMGFAVSCKFAVLSAESPTYQPQVNGRPPT